MLCHWVAAASTALSKSRAYHCWALSYFGLALHHLEYSLGHLKSLKGDDLGSKDDWTDEKTRKRSISSGARKIRDGILAGSR